MLTALSKLFSLGALLCCLNKTTDDFPLHLLNFTLSSISNFGCLNSESPLKS